MNIHQHLGVAIIYVLRSVPSHEFPDVVGLFQAERAAVLSAARSVPLISFEINEVPVVLKTPREPHS